MVVRPKGTQPRGGFGHNLPPPQPVSDHRLCFSPPVQVGKLNQDVVVRCDTSEQHIYWTLNGEEEPMAELVPEGQTLTILGLDLPATGNYSCWAGPVLLDTTYVVVSGTCTEGHGWGSQG